MVITAGSFDVLVEAVCEDDDHLLELVGTRIRRLPGVREHGDVRLPEAPQAALRLGNAMTGSTTPRGTDRADAARDHLWLHFTRHSAYADGAAPPIMVRGEGCHVWDAAGRSYLDGLAGLFVVQVGHGRRELAEAAARQAGELAFFPLWSYAHPAAIELAERLAPTRPAT